MSIDETRATQLSGKRHSFERSLQSQHDMTQLLILHGPNLNLLGTREPDYYGNTDLPSLNQELQELGQTLGYTIVCQQSNAEHELVDAVQQAKNRFAGIILNAAAYTHTSIALRDALLAVQIPFIEVHLSNPYAREPFRQTSYLADIAHGVICGFGKQSYLLALHAIHSILQEVN